MNESVPDFSDELKRWKEQCTNEKRKRCAKDSGDFFPKVCETCPSNPEVSGQEPSLWFQHIFFLYALQRGGYPFKADDLTIEEWLDIGLLKEELEAMKLGAKIG